MFLITVFGHHPLNTLNALHLPATLALEYPRDFPYETDRGRDDTYLGQLL